MKHKRRERQPQKTTGPGTNQNVEFQPDSTAAPPVKRPLRPSGRERWAAGGGTGEGSARSLPAARPAGAGRCPRLQYRRPEAAPRSQREVAMLPPPHLPAVTSAALARPLRVYAAKRAGTAPAWARARTRYAARGRHPPARGGAQHRQAPPITGAVNPGSEPIKVRRSSALCEPPIGSLSNTLD